MDNTLTVSNSEYIPCIVDGKNALFHTWEAKRTVILESVSIGGNESGVVQFTCGIVEFEDGEIKEVYPYEIKFIDNKLRQYCFEHG